MSNFKLPESAKAKVFVGFGVGVFNRGKISVGDFDISKHCSEGFETALVCETEMEFKFPSDFDPAAAYIGILEAKKQEINQEYSLRLVRINEKIAEARALPAPEPDKKCAGLDCESTDGQNHSALCELEHELTVAGVTAQMGEVYREERYAGYTGAFLNKNWSDGQKKAYLEGAQARGR